MTTSILSNGNRYRYKVVLEWENMPSTRSYDVIGIGFLASVKVASKKQLEIYENFQQIEEYIVSTQKLNIANDFEFNGDVYNRVFELLKSVESVE